MQDQTVLGGAWTCGQRVVIQGLQARPDLNGLGGEVVEVLANGRLKVRLFDHDEVPSVPFLSVKPENLRLIDDSDLSSVNSEEPVFVPLFSPMQTVWPMSNIFYAFGNTSAKRLTAHLPPDQESASILLLGCGDWRHLLFTSWCHEKAGGLVAGQTHEVLACDTRPAIMSRNLILWKLIYDGADLRMAWMLFYSKVFDNACLELLRNTANSLLQLACKDGTPNWTHWNASVFGRLCPFTHVHGFRQVCELWRAYTQHVPIGSEEDVKLKHHGKQLELSNILHTAPVTNLALQNMHAHNEYEKLYVAGTVEMFRSIYAFPPGSRLEMMRSNPMMLEGIGDGVYLYYALDPPSAFHPGLCYGPLQNTEAVLPGLVYANRPSQFHMDMLTTNAFAEFSAWCQATKARMDRQLIKVHVHVGDAFDLVRMLTARRVRPSRGTRDFTRDRCLGVDGIVEVYADVPIVFDVIDTSNLSDYYGLLNILLSCKPLLKESLTSTLFTENLASHAQDTTSLSKLLEPWLGTDIETFATLTGLVLMDYPSTTCGHLKIMMQLHETPAMLQGSTLKSYLFLRWKMFPTDSHCESHALRLSMTKDTFIEVFYSMYCRLFGTVLKPMENRPVIERYHQVMPGIAAKDYIHSTAHTFALLLTTCMYRMATLPNREYLWLLDDRIYSSKMPLQIYVFHEVTSWLAYYDVLTPEDLLVSNEKTFASCGVQRDDVLVERFVQGRDPKDALVFYVTLLVPKAVLDRAVFDIFNDPIVELSVSSEQYTSGFSNVKLLYLCDLPEGSTDWTLDSLSPYCTTKDKCTMVACTALVPLTSLVFPDMDIQLRFPPFMMKYNPEVVLRIGWELIIYKASLEDRTKVAWTAMEYATDPVSTLLRQSYRPAADPVELRCTQCNDILANVSSVGLTKGASQLLLTARLDFLDPALLRGAAPVVRQLAAPHEVEVQITTEHAVKVLFPVPVDVDRLRMQVSRAKGFINLLAVPLSLKTVHDRFAHVYLDTAVDVEHPRLALYGTSYVYLDTLVEVKVDIRSDIANSIMGLILLSMTKEECRWQLENSPHRSAVGAWKSSLHCLMSHFSPMAGPARRWAALSDPENNLQLLIYINSVKEEYTIERSVLLDVAVCSVDVSNRSDIMPWVQRMQRSNALINVLVTVDETKLWKRMLPGLIERTRTDWTHGPTCEYLRSSRIPWLDEFSGGAKVVCSCGLGQQLEDTPFMKELRASNSTRMAAYFARAAIPWIFSLEQFTQE